MRYLEFYHGGVACEEERMFKWFQGGGGKSSNEKAHSRKVRIQSECMLNHGSILINHSKQRGAAQS